MLCDSYTDCIGVFECYIDIITLTHVHTYTHSTGVYNSQSSNSLTLHYALHFWELVRCTSKTQFCLQAL